MSDCISRMEISLPRSEKWILHSETGHSVYEICVAKPKEPAPPSGYPVIYVLDGNAFFHTFREIIRLQTTRPEKTGILPAIIVGIGYPVKEEFPSAYRIYDFTPPSSLANLPLRPNGEPWPKTGGAELFLNFIEKQLKPQLHKQFHLDANRQTLFGHSLGGMFALNVLFTKTDAFQTYIVGSPSIWWNNQCILEKEQQFISRLKKNKADTRVFFAVGSLEKEHIIRDVKEMSNRLSGLHDSGLQIEFHEVEGENHISVIPAILSRALRFVFGH
ncbi:MAG: alpha/beta hydrolase-fold protein [Thermoactinomyces sp.]